MQVLHALYIEVQKVLHFPLKWIYQKVGVIFQMENRAVLLVPENVQHVSGVPSFFVVFFYKYSCAVFYRTNKNTPRCRHWTLVGFAFPGQLERKKNSPL